MPLFNLLQRPFDNDRELEEWTFSHYQDHIEIIEAIQANANYGQNLTHWEIWPLNKDDIENWLLKHQQLHDDMNSALSLQGVDLESIDFEDKQARDIWIDINYREHLSARSTLAI